VKDRLVKRNQILWWKLSAVAVWASTYLPLEKHANSPWLIRQPAALRADVRRHSKEFLAIDWF
jgi:hypothetical protein